MHSQYNEMGFFGKKFDVPPLVANDKPMRNYVDQDHVNKALVTTLGR